MFFSHRYRRRRRGAAAVECAICLPLLVTIVFGAIEACSMIFVQQALKTTAYECARMAASPLGDHTTAQALGVQMLDDRNVAGGAVTIVQAPMPGVSQMEVVTVTATAPVASNRILPRWFFADSTLSAQCSMVDELPIR